MTEERAQQVLNKPAYINAGAYVGNVVTADMLEDPEILQELIDGYVMPDIFHDECLTVGEVLDYSILITNEEGVTKYALDGSLLPYGSSNGRYDSLTPIYPSFVHASKRAGYDYQFDYMTDFDTSVQLVNPDALPSNFILFIQGYADRPEIHIGNNVIQFNVEVPEGAILEVNAVTKTTTLHMPDGTNINVFGARNTDYYIFERIPPGFNAVTWNGSFTWEITLIEERSEPRWLTV